MLQERLASPGLQRPSMMPGNFAPDKLAAARERLARKTITAVGGTPRAPLAGVSGFSKPPLPVSRLHARGEEAAVSRMFEVVTDATSPMPSAREGFKAGVEDGRANPQPDSASQDGDVYEPESAIDPSSMLDPLVVQESPLVMLRPTPWFEHSLALMPDGHGVSRQQAYVAEPLSADEFSPPAYHSLLLAAEAAACHSAGIHDGLRSRDDALDAADGVARGTVMPMRRAALRRLVQIEAREWFHTQASAGRRVRRLAIGPPLLPPVVIQGEAVAVAVDGDATGQPPGSGATSNSSSNNGNAGVSVQQSLSDVAFSPAFTDAGSVRHLAAQVVARVSHDKLVHTVARIGVSASLSSSYKVPPVSFVGSASAVGARLATELPPSRLRPWDTDMDASAGKRHNGQARGGRGDADEKSLLLSAVLAKAGSEPGSSNSLAPPKIGPFSVKEDDSQLLRIVRPMAGDASDIALATREPCTLTIHVDGVAFHDHPLFSREDKAAMDIRTMYEGYSRLMRTDAVSNYDGRLQALLAYTTGASTPGRPTLPQQSAAAAGAETPGTARNYDFTLDTLPELCARASAALHTLSLRYDAVTSVAELARKIWGRWGEVTQLRASTAVTCTCVRVEAREAATANNNNSGTPHSPQGSGPPPVPSLYPHLYALARLLSHLSAVYQSSGGGGGGGDVLGGDDHAKQLLEAGEALLDRIRVGEAKYGAGYGCGGLGSGLGQLSVTSSSNGNGGSEGAPSPFPGAVEHVMRLHWDVPLTQDIACPPWERARRQAIYATFVCAEVYLNNQFVARSPPARLSFPDFFSPVRATVALRLYRRPTSISVKLCDVSSMLWRLLGPRAISAVYLPVPGAEGGGNRRGGGSSDPLPTTSLMPVTGNFEFSAMTPLVPHSSTLAALAATFSSQPTGMSSVMMSTRSVDPRAIMVADRLTHGTVGAVVEWTSKLAADRALASATSGVVGVSVSGDSGEKGAGGGGQAVGVLPPAERYTGQHQGTSANFNLSRLTLAGMSEGQRVGGPTPTSHRTSGGLPTSRRGSDAGGSGIASSLMRTSVGSPGRTSGKGAAASRLMLQSQSTTTTAAMGTMMGGGGGRLTSTTGIMDAASEARFGRGSGGGGGGRGDGGDGVMSPASLFSPQGGPGSTAAVEAASTALGAPGASYDPNDPRSAALARHTHKGGSGHRRHARFRVTALADSTAFRQPGAAAMMLGGMGHKNTGSGLTPSVAASMTLEFLPGSVLGRGSNTVAGMAAASMAPAGAQRLRLLRLRAERPDLFSNVACAIPLRDEDVVLVPQLRDLLRTVLLPAAGAEAASKNINATAWALAALFHAANAAGSDGGVEPDGESTAATMQYRMKNRIHAFLARMHANPMMASRKRRHVSLASILKEITLPNGFMLDMRSLAVLLAPRRRLRPLGIDAGLAYGGFGASGLSMMPRGHPGGSYRITVQVVRARNLPVRKAGSTSASSTSAARGEGDDIVLAMVEASFQGHLVKSAVVPGPNPQWNQVLALPFTPPGQYVTPAVLAQIGDVLTLSLFDEQMSEVRVDDRDALTTIVQRQRRYLGTVQVPFFTLYSQGGVHGELRLDTPRVLLGYQPPGVIHMGPSTAGAPGGATRTGANTGVHMGATSTSVNMAAPGMGMSMGVVSGIAGGGGGGLTGMPEAASPGGSYSVGLLDQARVNGRNPHLYVHITVDPPLPTATEEETMEVGGPLTSTSKLRHTIMASTRGDGQAELRRVMEHAVAWMGKYGGILDEDGKQRVVRPIVQTIDGEAALLFRYLGAQQPPPEPLAAAQASGTLSPGAALGLGLGQGGVTPSSSVPTTPMRGSNMFALSPARSTMGTPRGDYSASGMLSPGAATPGGGGGGGSGLSPTSTGSGEVVSALVPRMATIEALARFVSLIPFLPDSQAFNAADTALDVWATTQQTLDMGAGDAEEHAVMLHNFLLWLDPHHQSGSPSMPGANMGGGGGGVFGAVTSPLAGGPHSNPLALTGSGGSSGGWQTFLVLGRAQPDGETVYVMRQVRTNTTVTTVLIDASSGIAYLSDDDTCPLRSIGMVASVTNCWANIQPHAQPWRMAFDLSNALQWAPMFTPKMPFPGPEVIPLVQPPVLYRSPEVKIAGALEAEIHTHLCAQLRSWRPRYVTRIRGDLSTHLKGLLLELEARALGLDGPTTILSADGPVTVGGGMSGGRSSGLTYSPAAIASATRDLAAEHLSSLERMASRFRVQGFPLHATFTDMDALVTLVRSTSVHRVEEEGVQYGIAVAVLPYPNAVFSVWMYVVVLQPLVNIPQAA